MIHVFIMKKKKEKLAMLNINEFSRHLAFQSLNQKGIIAEKHL